MKKSSPDRGGSEKQSGSGHTQASRFSRDLRDHYGQKPSSRNPRRNAAKSAKPEDVALADRLHSAAIHLLRRVRKEDASTGEGPARLSALSVLVFGGAKTLGELAAAEQVKPPTMSRIVAGLERSHLVEIARDAADARRMCIRASAKGTRLLQAARHRRVATLAAQLQMLPPEEFAKLRDAAEILRRLLADWR